MDCKLTDDNVSFLLRWPVNNALRSHDSIFVAHVSGDTTNHGRLESVYVTKLYSPISAISSSSEHIVQYPRKPVRFTHLQCWMNLQTVSAIWCSMINVEPLWSTLLKQKPSVFTILFVQVKLVSSPTSNSFSLAWIISFFNLHAMGHSDVYGPHLKSGLFSVWEGSILKIEALHHFKLWEHVDALF